MDRIRVGAFELLPKERLLCQDGRPVELGARAFDLLLVLVEHAGRLASKDMLIERVWPNLVVDENNLPAQVASLRRVLGAGAISTVPKYGYRLDLEVSTPPAEVPPPPVPASTPTLVGRDDDLQATQQALAQARLLTIAGGAGIGKTRLAQQIHARSSAQAGTRTAWVSLEPLNDVVRVPSAIALALGLSLPDGNDRFQALADAMEPSPVLLFLDGAEHLAEALAGRLSGLLARVPGLRLVVTSQVPLGIAGESIYRLSALALPPPGTPPQDQARHGAIALFSMRASQADQRFEVDASNVAEVADICRRLDGNPLAIELAAARAPALGLATLRERLDDRFRLLKQPGKAADPRHGVLQAALDWSYGLLSPEEQRVFNRLGAFAGGFALDTAARCVADGAIDTCGAIDLIGRLVDRSLVAVVNHGASRHRMLETARCYAVERLAAAGELDAARRRMAGTMLGILERAYEEYWSQDEKVWLSRYEPELDNVRAAMHWAHHNDPELAIALYGTAWPLFVETDQHAEGRAGHAEALALLSDTLPPARVARFWEAIATYESTRQYDRARHAAELAASLHARAGDVRAHYYTLNLLALNWRDDIDSARAACEEANRLEDPAWPARLLAQGAMTEAALLTSRREFAAARDASRRALRLALTNSERQALAATVNVVELDIACGATDAALQLGRPLVLSLRRVGRRETRFELLVNVMRALLLARETREASQVGAELYALALRLDPGQLYMVLDSMALLACQEGHHGDAARIAIFADAAYAAHGQAGRGPAAERVRAELVTALEQSLGADWASRPNGRDKLDEASACRLALGLE